MVDVTERVIGTVRVGQRDGFGKERLFLSDRNPRGQAHMAREQDCKERSDTSRGRVSCCRRRSQPG